MLRSIRKPLQGLVIEIEKVIYRLDAIGALTLDDSQR
jgi:hypothetical protein